MTRMETKLLYSYGIKTSPVSFVIQLTLVTIVGPGEISSTINKF